MSRRSSFRVWLLGPFAVVLLSLLPTAGVRADAPLAGSQGTDTSLPATASQVTVHGRGQFSNLAVTVNQTSNLTDQAVSITWTGGTPTIAAPTRFGAQFLQIFQCWGDADSSVAGDPGPPPQQCEQGAVGGTPNGLPGTLYPFRDAMNRTISRMGYDNFVPTDGYYDSRTTELYLPFRSVDGTVVNEFADPNFNPAVSGGNFWLNPYYNQTTTNEIAGAATGPDGKGAELFQVLTGVQSSGLGCGQKVQPVAGGGKAVPKCWIVVVPRGSAADENVGTPSAQNADQNGVTTSPVSPRAWQNRIAIPIDFNPVDSPCPLGADERRLSGSELALPAVASWQPTLCATSNLPPYSFSPISDSTARQQLLSGQPGAPGMVVVSKPISADQLDPASPVVYAPLTASGIVIGFNIERSPSPTAPTDAQQIAGVRIAQLHLTPRLVAKLLTQSYQQAVNVGASSPNYPWATNNPAHLGTDPDFLQFNPEFNQLLIQDGRTFSGLQLPEGTSDAAQQVWQWVLADPEAHAWMDGAPDPWGMKVNPVYATTAAVNPSGEAFGDPLPNTFPKSDPYCYQAAKQGPNNSITPPKLCGTDWMPYRNDFSDAARVTRIAADGAKIDNNQVALNSSDVWTREGPQYLGRRDMLSLTDTPSAAQYGVQTASLSRAGDDGANRSFISADSAGIATAVAAMKAGDESQVLETDPVHAPAGAYPLPAVTYAAVQPLALEASARSDYASFIDYAVGAGQVPGLALGQLPRGYAPLTDALKQQAATASATIKTLQPAPTTTTTTTATTTAPTTSTPTTESSTTVESQPPVASTPTTTRRSTTTTRPSTTTTASAAATESSSSIEPTTETPSAEPSSSAASSAAPPVTSTSTPATTTTTRPPTAITPFLHLARSRFAAPALGVVALGSGLGALELTKRPRRRRAAPPAGGAGPDPTDAMDGLDGLDAVDDAGSAT